MRPLAPELDECSLQNIFHKVGDARQLARCSMVCKRWQRLCYSATRLIFDFTNSESELSEEEMWVQEHAMATVLSRARSKAPGCLKKLKVEMNVDSYKASSHWLAFADSLTTLELSGDSGSWGPGVWSYVLTSRTLKKLVIWSSFAFFTPPEGWISPNLKTCDLADVSMVLLQVLLAACPALEVLRVQAVVIKETESFLTVSTASLETFHLIAFSSRESSFQLLLHNVPSLRTLCFGQANEQTTTAIRTAHSLDKLTCLALYGFSTLDQVFNNVETLMLMEQSWITPERVATIFKHTPAVKTLRLDCRFSGCCISSLLSRLVSLERVHVDAISLDSLASDVKLERLTVHFWLNSYHVQGITSKLRSLLACCGIRMLVVESFQASELWEDMSELLLQYPERVLFKPMVSYQE